MILDLTFMLQNGGDEKHSSKLEDSMPSWAPTSSNDSSLPRAGVLPTNLDRASSVVTGSTGTSRSSSIPLPSSHVTRTQSELQLTLDEQAAEQRDADMFSRLVNGIRERQTDMAHSERSIASIVHTRLCGLQEEVSPDTSDMATSLPHPHHDHWCMLHSTREPLSEASDEWSITGFEAHQSMPTITAPTLAFPQHAREEETDDEGGDNVQIFDMDL